MQKNCTSQSRARRIILCILRARNSSMHTLVCTYSSQQKKAVNHSHEIGGTRIIIRFCGIVTLSVCHDTTSQSMQNKQSNMYAQYAYYLVLATSESSIYYTTSGMYAKYCSMHTIFQYMCVSCIVLCIRAQNILSSFPYF